LQRAHVGPVANGDQIFDLRIEKLVELDADVPVDRLRIDDLIHPHLEIVRANLRWTRQRRWDQAGTLVVPVLAEGCRFDSASAIRIIRCENCEDFRRAIRAKICMLGGRRTGTEPEYTSRRRKIPLRSTSHRLSLPKKRLS